jgi:hypothetical protein
LLTSLDGFLNVKRCSSNIFCWFAPSNDLKMPANALRNLASPRRAAFGEPIPLVGRNVLNNQQSFGFLPISTVHGDRGGINEGYHGASPDAALRTELCHEAMRLAALLLDHPVGATPETYALSALMCLNAARLPARVDAAGHLASLVDQDRSLWDQKLERLTRIAGARRPYGD